VGLKLNGTHQLSFYADDVNLLGDSKDTIKKNTDTSIDEIKEVGLEENARKSKPSHSMQGKIMMLREM
jgi:hypothetical protein